MKIHYRMTQILALVLAGLLQIAPLVRSILPAQGLAPSAWAYILQIGVGATALLGFDAVSQASSISISPPNATVGVPYVGTVTYSGGHAGSVSSMTLTNQCLSTPYSLCPGLNIVYAGGNSAAVSGTPTAAGTNAFTLKVWDYSGCPTSGESDTRSTTLIVEPAGGAPVAPSTPILANSISQLGSTVQLNGVSSGNPIPQYQWWTGLGNPIPGATNSFLTITNLQLTNAGIYTLTASNSSTAGYTFGSLPKGNCFLSVAISGGTNFTAYDYTNYAPAGVPLTMFSYLTNGTSTTTNYYAWTYNGSPTPVLSTSNTFSLSASLLTPSKSGTYTVTMNSSNAGGPIVVSQSYDSYWAFGYRPVFTNSLPATTNVNAGSSVSFSLPVGGTLNIYDAGTAGSGGYQTSSVPCLFWYLNGTNLVASQIVTNNPTSLVAYSNTFTTASLTLPSVSPDIAGSYTLVATNFWGSITSSPVVLGVTSLASAPVITANPPAALALLAGQSTALSVTVTGTPSLFYQWSLEGTNLTDGGVYSGSLTNVLNLRGVTLANGGDYSLVITNVAGAVTSSVTALSVSLPPQLTASASSGSLQVSASTITDLTYVVESASNLVDPVWVPVLTNSSGNSGQLNFQTNAVGNGNNFFRLMFP